MGISSSYSEIVRVRVVLKKLPTTPLFQIYTWQLQAVNDTVLAIQADSYLSKLSTWPLKNSLMTILNSISKTSFLLF